jgi:hypothetical protein
MELQPRLGLCSKRGIGIATVDRADSGADGIPSPQLLNNHPGCAALVAEPWMARSSNLEYRIPGTVTCFGVNNR